MKEGKEMDHRLKPVLPNFEEDTKGFTPAEALEEANRCLNCKKPLCREGCPVNNNIPGFIQEIKNGSYQTAYKVILETSNLPAICSRVCPHEKQCQSTCILGKKGKPVSIGKLERFVADNEEADEFLLTPPTEYRNQKIAIIGSGPAGLAASGDLAKLGYLVTVFEAESNPGGVLIYGIPEYRLPKTIVKKEISKLQKLGINFITDTVIGEDLSIDDLLKQGFDAVFIASGAGSPRKLNIRGVYLPGVYYANYFLATVNLVNLGKLHREEIPVLKGDDVVVIGAGNVAIDAARTSVRLGADKVSVLYRGDYSSIPALKSELQAAQTEGVEILCLTMPVKILGTTRVTGVQCLKVVPEKASGEFKELSSSEFKIKADRIILAIGQRPRSRIVSTTENVKTYDNGYVVTSSENFGHTTREGVFAGGDVVTTPATVVSAMSQGRAIAKEIHNYLQIKIK